MGIFIALKVIFSLLLVIVIMYGALKLVQKYTKFGTKLNHVEGSLKIDSILYVDDGVKIVSLLRGKTNYILAINKQNFLLIDKHDFEK